MRDEKSFSAHSAAATLPADAVLSWREWQSLPVSTRIAERLVEILILASELRAELERQEAAPLLWMAPEIERVLEQTDEALQRLAS